MVERDRMLKELDMKGFHESRTGEPLTQLSYDDLKAEYVRLPELKEVSESK